MEVASRAYRDNRTNEADGRAECCGAAVVNGWSRHTGKTWADSTTGQVLPKNENRKEKVACFLALILSLFSAISCNTSLYSIHCLLLQHSHTGQDLLLLLQCSHTEQKSSWPQLWCLHVRQNGWGSLKSLSTKQLFFFNYRPMPEHHHTGQVHSLSITSYINPEQEITRAEKINIQAVAKYASVREKKGMKKKLEQNQL